MHGFRQTRPSEMAKLEKGSTFSAVGAAAVLPFSAGWAAGAAAVEGHPEAVLLLTMPLMALSSRTPLAINCGTTPATIGTRRFALEDCFFTPSGGNRNELIETG